MIYQKENSNYLTINSDFKTTIHLYNLLGQLVKKQVKNDIEINLNIASLPKNVYVVHFELKGKQIIKKIIIK